MTPEHDTTSRQHHRQTTYQNVVSEFSDRLDERGAQLPDQRGQDPTVFRYLLVEEGTQPGSRGTIYLTLHHTMDEAANHSVGQECVGEWTVVELVDLDTGMEYDGILEIRWEEA